MADTPPPVQVTSMEAFFTRKGANEGVPLRLRLPTGEETNIVLQVRGVDSDAFRLAETDRARELAALAAIEDENARKEATRHADLLALVPMVASWNLPEPCTPENVLRLFEESPQIADQVNTVAGSRARFFGERSRLSSSTGSTSSS